MTPRQRLMGPRSWPVSGCPCQSLWAIGAAGEAHAPEAGRVL
jgi:hypothetical protein